MKRFTGIGALALFAVIALGNARSVQAEGWFADYHEAKTASVVAGTRLLVVLDDPTQPQHSVEQVSTMTSAVEAELLKPYTTCRIDVSTEKGKEMASKFRATEFPYTAVIDKAGKFIVYKNQGKYSNSEWVSMLLSYAKEELPTQAAASDANCFT